MLIRSRRLKLYTATKFIGTTTRSYSGRPAWRSPSRFTQVGDTGSNMTTNGSQLKFALWEAANTLRGSAVDRTDWKGYILPLLFFKRISDVWDEETAEAAEIYGDADPSIFPANNVSR